MKLPSKIAIFLMLIFAGPLAAEPSDATAQWKAVASKALFALISGDHATALHFIRPLADRGVAEAQVHLGTMYAEGLGVAQNDVEAMKWFRLAADQGSVYGQHRLGEMYYLGRGAPQNYDEALKWFQLSAEQEDEMNAWARSRLGDMYSNGEGVPQDYVRAYMWYLLAIDSNHVLGIPGLERISPQMTPEQMTEGTKLWREWKESHPSKHQSR